MEQLELVELSYSIILTAFVFNIAIALYGLFTRPSLFKKIISLILFSDTINIIAVAIGFRVHPAGSIPPIHSEIPTTLEELVNFSQRSVDPLLQAFVITAVVIGLSIMIFLISIMLRYHELHGSITIENVLEGEKTDEII